MQSITKDRTWELVSIRISTDMLNRISARAKNGRRSLNKEVNLILDDYFTCLAEEQKQTSEETISC